MDFKKKLKAFFTFDRRANDGFTLVELIVVIAILAILGGVAVPAYSGYIKKAERANDEALLNAINTAFASACVVNGESNYGRTDVVASLSDGTFTYTAPFADSFVGFYEEGGEFKAFEAIVYYSSVGAFKEATAAGARMYNTLREKFGDKIASVLATNLGQIGTGTLFDQMNGAINLAGELNLNDLAGENFFNAYMEYLGVDLSEFDLNTEEGSAQAQAAIDAKLQALGVDDDVASTNAIALYAAQKSIDVETTDLSKWFGKTTEDMKNDGTGETLAEAAAIYGLYLSYAKEKNIEVPTDNALDVMSSALTNTEFANWVNTNANAQTELDAYKTYMEMVNEAAKDDATRDDILANGFNNPELENLMSQLMGN